MFGKCHCVNVEFGSYDNQVVMKHPSGKLVCIDTCIASEIGYLWHKGINTLNSCCGHQKLLPEVIVSKEDYDLMDKMGYDYEIAPSGLRAYHLKTRSDLLEYKEKNDRTSK